MISDRFFYSEFASFCRTQLQFSFFLFLSKTPWRWEVKSRKFQLVSLTIGAEIAKILASSIDDSLSAWIELLDGTRIRTLVNLLYLGIRDNHWNYVNFETLETHWKHSLMSRNTCNGENGEKSPASGDLDWMPKVASWRLAIWRKWRFWQKSPERWR